MNLKEVKIEAEGYNDTVVCLTDLNHIMIKQGKDLVCLPTHLVPELIAALNKLITP